MEQALEQNLMQATQAVEEQVSAKNIDAIELEGLNSS